MLWSPWPEPTEGFASLGAFELFLTDHELPGGGDRILQAEIDRRAKPNRIDPVRCFRSEAPLWPATDAPERNFASVSKQTQTMP